MSGGVLDEARLVAETVTAVLALTVKMRLVLPIAAVLVLTVFVEPESQVAFRHRLVLQDAHRVLQARLLRLGRDFVRAQSALVQVRGHRRQWGGQVLRGVGGQGALHQSGVLKHELRRQAGGRGVLVETLRQEGTLHGLLLRH